MEAVMDQYLAMFNFASEVIFWLKKIGHQQAMHVLSCLAKVLDFSQGNEDFFQGCGLYVVGSSLHKENFNDIDLVLAGLDFRAVVAYNKIFLMDPDALIEEGVLVKPQCFLVIKEEENAEAEIHQPVTSIQNPDFITFLNAFNRYGLSHNGIQYDYNFEEHGWNSGTLEGYCSNQARPSSFTNQMSQLLVSDDVFTLNHPFDNYGFEGKQRFLVYRFSIEEEKDLPGVEGSILDEVKPIDFCIHAENLYREEWKRHQTSLQLPYLTLKEWPAASRVRKIITELDYPRFIDPNGVKRAERDWMFFCSFDPGEVVDAIDV